MPIRSLIAIVWWTSVASSAASGQPVSYQGRLVDGEMVANGSYDITFTVWDALSGGMALASDMISDVEVVNGLFSTGFDVDSTAFVGGPRWLGITIDGIAVGPRQLIRSAPVARTIDGVLFIHHPSNGGRPSLVVGSDHVLSPESEGSVIGGGSGHTVAGQFVTIGGGDRQVVSADAGTVSGGLFNEVSSYGATIGGGIQNRATGRRSTVCGGSVNVVTGDRGFIGGGDTNTNDGAFSVIGGGASNQLSGQFASLLGGRNNRVAGDYSVVLGGRDAAVFADNGLAFGDQAIVNHARSAVISLSANRFESSGPQELIIDAPGGIGIGRENPSAALDVNGSVIVAGTLRSAVVEITGGSDLAEPFTRSSGLTVQPQPGMVLSIDPDQPGALTISSEDYDTKVAGVYSGANGLPTGLIMGRDRDPLTANGPETLPVAMTGRVWVLADESNGRIAPGDRLTTSGTRPGYAMRVTDQTRSIGAVIGKAMTHRDSESGMVLVLVNLQ